MDVAKHIERNLGAISRGWKENADSGLPQVVAVKNQPWNGVTTYSSLGLSAHVLHLPSNKDVRQEFILGDSGTLSDDTAVSLILWLCELALKSHQAVTRGQVIRLNAEMAKTLSCDALYCSIPVVYEKALATFDASEPATVFVWVVPLKAAEADFVEENGWSEFEDLLERRAPNLFDLTRGSVV